MMIVAHRNLILIGFASTGKSTTGRQLAVQLGYQFVDLDDIVEAIHFEEFGERRRCREIFSLLGRAYFIDCERRALERLGDKERMVLATGGGTPIDPHNREQTRALGLVIYLSATVAAIWTRMAGKGFPDYLSPNPKPADLERHWRERDAIYRSIADVTIDTSEQTPEGTVDRIMARVDSMGALTEESRTERK